LQPTQQQLVPFNFFAGSLPSSPVDLAWVADSDFVITCITFTADNVAGEPLARITDASGNIRYNRILDGVAATYPQAVVDKVFMIMGPNSGAVLASNSGDAWISIDGYLLQPAGSSIW
jgi:hypothetical protein